MAIGEIGVATGGGWTQKEWENETVAQADTRIAWDIEHMADTGFKWVRWDWPWSSIEQKPGVYFFDRRIRIANDIKAAGMKVLPIAGYTPTMYQQSIADAQFAPPDPRFYAAWDRYITALMPVYRECGITRAELWNESNHMPFWHYPDVDVQAELVRRSLPIIARLHTQFRWVIGAFSPAPDKTVNGRVTEINPVTYIRQWYAHGHKAKALGPWSIHPYHDGEPGERPPSSLMTVQYDAIKATLAANGHGSKKVWGTEFGHTTQPNDAGGRTQRSESEQARLIVAQMDMWRRRPGAGVGTLFNWQEFPTPRGTINGLGIVRLNGTFKPARQAVKELLT